MMHLVQQQNRSPLLSARFSLGPAALPKARQCSVRIVACGVDGLAAELSGDVQKQRSLTHLPWTGEKLNATGRGFTEPFEQHITAMEVGVLNLSHSLIIIRLWTSLCQIECQNTLCPANRNVNR